MTKAQQQMERRRLVAKWCINVEINSVVYTFRILDADKFGGFRRLSRMPQGTAKPHGS
nr:hypothetical protein [uncultured Kingella sp.]